MTPEAFQAKKEHYLKASENFLEAGNELIGLKIRLNALKRSSEFRILSETDEDLLKAEEDLQSLLKFFNDLNYINNPNNY